MDPSMPLDALAVIVRTKGLLRFKTGERAHNNSKADIVLSEVGVRVEDVSGSA